MVSAHRPARMLSVQVWAILSLQPCMQREVTQGKSAKQKEHTRVTYLLYINLH